MNRTTILRVFLVVLLFVASAYPQSDKPIFPNPGKTSMSKENQHALGMKVADKVYQQMPVLPDDSPESQYVRQLGQKLVDTIPREYSWPFEFHVVPQKEINAFALPGGQMFVNIGTITAAKNEAELAGVMGHEMAHVYMQHSAKQASKAQTTNMISGLASSILGGTVGGRMGGMVGQLGQMGIQMGTQGLMMKYSRNDESQADAVGAVILYKAGYNPQGMADFFHTMGSQGGSAPPQFFSSHPNPENRQVAIQKQISNWPVANYGGNSPEFEKVREHAMHVQSYSASEIAQGAKSGHWAAMNQQNGASLNSSGSGIFPTRSAAAMKSPTAIPLENVLPSQQMVNTTLGPMTINYPENWQVTLPEQQGQFVTIAAPKAITNRGLGYGVLLNGVMAPGGNMTIDQVTAQLIQKIQEKNEMEQVNKPEPIMVGGIEGRSTLLRSPSPFPDANGQPQKERDWLVTVLRQDGSIIFMIFLAPESDFTQFEPTFQTMIKSAKFK
jgi:hypothetical protein